MFQVSLSRSCARRFFVLCAGLVATFAALCGQTPSAADGFDPNVDGNVFAAAAQGDGKVIIGGQFTALRPNGSFENVARANLARLNADGTVDTAFDVRANGPVRTVVIQPGGQILLGGDFTQLQIGGAAAVTRNRIARLHGDGTLDTAFNPNLSGSIQPQVYAIAVQADGRIVVGGRFATVQPTGATAATARRNLVRLTAAGALDNTFDPSPNGLVLSLAAHSAGRVIVGGGFTGFQPAGATAVTTRNRVARINSDGSLDASFDPNANNAVSTIAVQRDGKIVLGGSFTSLQPVGTDSAASRSRLARLNVDGTLDGDFYPSAGGNVSALAVQPDGGLLIGGTFNAVWGRGAGTFGRSFLARFTPEGAVDTGFEAGVNAEVDALALNSDGRIVAGGYFTRILPEGATVARLRNRVARFNANGTLDTNFELSAGGRPLVSAVQADGKIVVGGSFNTISGAVHNYLARLNADGSVDSSYNPDFNGRVLALAYETSSGKMVVGGSFTAVNGETRNRLARLNANGTLDTSFNPNVDGTVAALLFQSDGKLLVGGAFNSVQPPDETAAVVRANVFRLTTTGSVDKPFDPNLNASVTSMVIQSDGKIVLGGDFTQMIPNSGTTTFTRSRLARFNADGTLDTTYDPNFNGQINSLALQADGKIVAVGAFTLLQPNGIGTFLARNRIVRLNVDGTADTGFDPNANGTIFTVALQSDQKLLIGGSFTTLQPNGASNWTLRKYMARLNTDGTVDTFNLDLDETAGNKVESIRVLADGRILFSGVFSSLQPDLGAPRIVRPNLARVSAAGVVDTALDITAAGSSNIVVSALALQSDGKAVVAGSFSEVGGSRTANIARFHPEGTADATFSAALATDGPVLALAIRPNAEGSPAQLSGLAWLNANGTLRSGFAPGANGRLSGRINATLPLPDGSVIVAGLFTNLSGAIPGNIARFAANGTLDTSFGPSVNGEILDLVLQADGRIVIAGSFTQVNGTSRAHIARLEASGALDANYDPNINGTVNALALQPDGRIVVGGGFNTLTPNGTTTAASRTNLARINTDGTIDTFAPNPNNTVRALALQPDGKVIAGGDFTTVQPGSATVTTDRRFLARINADGGLDAAFDPNPNGSVYAILVQPDGAVVFGGSFTTLQPNAGSVTSRYYLARVTTHGVLDTSFNPYPNGSVFSLALQTDGSIVVGGLFTTLQPNGAAPIARQRLARIAASGALDTTFNPDVIGEVGRVALTASGGVLVSGSVTGLQSAGLVIVGGSFNTIGGTPARRLAMLSNDGSVSTFLPQPNGNVRAILALPDGRFIVGGDFTSIAGGGRNRIARFNADGSVDSTFTCSIDGPVHALAGQPDGKILVGGQFTSVNGVTRAFLARLDPNGSLDGTFAPSVTLPTATDIASLSLAVQPDGRILVLRGTVPALNAIGFAGSSLTRLNSNGTADTSFATVTTGEEGIMRSMALQADGKIAVGGSFLGLSGPVGSSTLVARLARINSNGTIDTTFQPAPNGTVGAVALQSDGRLLFGGSFTKVGGLTRIGLARVVAGSAPQELLVTFGGNRVAWKTTGAIGQMSGVRFEISSDRQTWTLLGDARRLDPFGGSWVLSGQQLPATGPFYIRATGIVPTGNSSGLYTQVREFNFASIPFSSTAPAEGTIGVPEWSYVDRFTGIHYGMLEASVYPIDVMPIPPVIVPAKVTGDATEVASNIRHPNGNVYDQVLMRGTVATVTADPGQTVRISYLSLNEDIVQVEFSGAGSLTITLAAASGPVAAQNYNQPSTTYMKGHASLTVSGANETTHVAVFSVGPLTAIDQSLFRDNVSYAGVADIAFVAIGSSNGKFGGLRSGNGSYFATSGLTGVYAPGVQFTGPLYVNDINGYDDATAMLVVGSATDVRVAGGDLFQANARPVSVSGVSEIQFVDGATSQGKLLPAQSNRAIFEQVDLSNR